MGTLTPGQASKAIEVLHAMAEVVRGLGEVPSGVLYAHCMGALTLEQYERAIDILVGAGLVERASAHVLRWIGPTLSVTPPT